MSKLSVLVDYQRVEVEADPKATVGQWADDLAKAHAIPGGLFSVKADGSVISRLSKAASLEGNLELVEITEATEVVAASEAPDSDE